MASRNAQGRLLYWKISYCKQLSRCSHIAQLLFTWGIPNTDDLGRMEGDPEILKGMLFPYDKKVTEKIIVNALSELHNEKLIIWYKVLENQYIQYPNFHKYQKLRADRTHTSDCPPPPANLNLDMSCHDNDKPCHTEGKGRELGLELELEGKGREKESFVMTEHDNSDLQNKINDWLKYKTEKDQSYKPTGLQNLLTQIDNKVKEYGEQAVIDIITESMAANWQGICFDKLKKDKKPEDEWK